LVVEVGAPGPCAATCGAAGSDGFVAGAFEGAAEVVTGDSMTASSNRVVSGLGVDVEVWPEVEPMLISGLTHSVRFAVPPSDGNSVSRTVNAAAVPPMAMKQYSIQPTNAFVRRRGLRGGVGSEPRNTLRIDALPEERRDEPSIIGCRLSPSP